MKEVYVRYDIERLSKDLGLDLEDIKGLFSAYIAEMAEESAEMQRLLLKMDWYMLERVVHNVKGVSANLGIMDVFDKAESFDSLIKNNDIGDASRHFEELKYLIVQAEISIREFFISRGLEI